MLNCNPIQYESIISASTLTGSSHCYQSSIRKRTLSGYSQTSNTHCSNDPVVIPRRPSSLTPEFRNIQEDNLLNITSVPTCYPTDMIPNTDSCINRAGISSSARYKNIGHICLCSTFAPGPTLPDVGHSVPSATLDDSFRSHASVAVSQGMVQDDGDDDSFSSDINLTDPLMTDIVGDLENWSFSQTGLLGPFDLNQCTFCSAPYLQQPTGFLSSFSPLSVCSVWPSDSYSNSSPASCSSPSSEVLSATSTNSSESVRSCKRKRKFFRSSRSVCLSETNPHTHRSQFANGVDTVANSSLRKRWNVRCSSAYLRIGRRLRLNNHAAHVPPSGSIRPFVSTDSRVVDSSLSPNASRPINPAVLDEGYISDSIHTSSVDSGPYAFDMSPTLRLSESIKHSSSRNHWIHASKRLHLLQFILKLLRDQELPKRASSGVDISPSDLTTRSPDQQFLTEAARETDDAVSSTISKDCVEWINETERIFAIKDPFRLAQLWGLYKNNRNMTFESLCRSLRLYYVPGKLERVRGQRNQYRLLTDVR
ncbi:ETS ous factor [Paragonimus heterotremus]|uniref:ETS ous factor n=1 Tax=Paragonimus heterotremus TaxID=100268 RepID=A0A8J4SMW4_9TREM|nr:ETS ous factor [Paragonimus heterotremus]